MNWIETVYCSQYYELKQNGRDPMKARLNGTLLTAIMILLALVVLLKMTGKFIPWHLPEESVLTGKTIGKLVALAGLLLVGSLLNFTIGSEKSYRKMMAGWEQLPDEVLKATIKRSLVYFMIVFAAFLFAVFFI
jgi:hypothetical protein